MNSLIHIPGSGGLLLCVSMFLAGISACDETGEDCVYTHMADEGTLLADPTVAEGYSFTYADITKLGTGTWRGQFPDSDTLIASDFELTIQGNDSGQAWFDSCQVDMQQEACDARVGKGVEVSMSIHSTKMDLLNRDNEYGFLQVPGFAMDCSDIADVQSGCGCLVIGVLVESVTLPSGPDHVYLDPSIETTLWVAFAQNGRIFMKLEDDGVGSWVEVQIREDSREGVGATRL